MPTRKRVLEEHEPRKSRRKHRQSPKKCTSPPKAVHLPTEVQLIVLEYLGKRDLKQLRLVSREWQSLATPLLFETIYVSPHQNDVETYKGITQNPMIAVLVKKLVYDVATFRLDLTYNEYWDWLFREFMSIAFRWKDEPFKCPDGQINSIVEQYKDTIAVYAFVNVRNIRFQIRRSHKHDSFVREGWRKYRANAAYEQRVLRDGTFFTCLYKGLTCLPSLRAISLSDVEWAADLMNRQPLDSATLYGPGSGSVLVRSWHPFHLRPHSRWYGANGGEDMTFHFQNLIQAIAETDKRVTTFEFKGLGSAEAGGLPSLAMTKSLMSEECLMQSLTAFRSLQHFDISVKAHSEEDSDNAYPIDYLPLILSRIHHLKVLRLKLDKRGHGADRYRFDQVFPRENIPSELTELSISGLAISAFALFVHLLWRQPRLRYLRLEDIDLLKGSWEGTIQGLHLMRLERFGIQGDCTYHKGTSFLPEIRDCDQVDWTQSVEEYVVDGGRHPCLEPDSPPFTELRWYLDLFPGKTEKEVDHRACQSRTEYGIVGGIWRQLDVELQADLVFDEAQRLLFQNIPIRK